VTSQNGEQNTARENSVHVHYKVTQTILLTPVLRPVITGRSNRLASAIYAGNVCYTCIHHTPNIVSSLFNGSM